jgi:hypothetical protein
MKSNFPVHLLKRFLNKLREKYSEEIQSPNGLDLDYQTNRTSKLELISTIFEQIERLEGKYKDLK